MVTKYASIDVGEGSYPNSIVNVEAPINSTYITNNGCNTIEDTCGITMSFKLVN